MKNPVITGSDDSPCESTNTHISTSPMTGYLTTHQFALEVGVRAETVRRWCRAGKLKPEGHTPTGQLRFHRRQVREALRISSPDLGGQEPEPGSPSQVLAAQIHSDMAREIRMRRDPCRPI